MQKLLASWQSGFRAGLGVSSVSMKVLDDIMVERDKIKISTWISSDYSKAFDVPNPYSWCCSWFRREISLKTTSPNELQR